MKFITTIRNIHSFNNIIHWLLTSTNNNIQYNNNSRRYSVHTISITTMKEQIPIIIRKSLSTSTTALMSKSNEEEQDKHEQILERTTTNEVETTIISTTTTTTTEPTTALHEAESTMPQKTLNELATTTSSSTSTRTSTSTGCINSHNTNTQHTQNTIHSIPTIEPINTYYKRPLPEKTCIALSSKNGKQLFNNALHSGGIDGCFFPLCEQHITQSEPAYCGISSLVISLNALAIDPKRTWRGSLWRWYDESMLNCCVDLNAVKTTGITVSTFKCLALCQGVHATVTYGNIDTNNSNNTNDTFEQQFRTAVIDACITQGKRNNGIHHSTNAAGSNSEDSDDDTDDNVAQVLTSVLLASYDREVLGQTGNGHFSPITAYDPITDSVLIMDTARFKYGSHWVQLSLLANAMKPIDPDSGRSRGFIVLTNPNIKVQEQLLQQEKPQNKLTSAAASTGTTTSTSTSTTTSTIEQSKQSLSSKVCTHTYGIGTLPVSALLRSELVRNNPARKEYKAFLDNRKKQQQQQLITTTTTLDDVINFWTKDGTDMNYIWELVKPKCVSPIDDKCLLKLINGVRSLICTLLRQHQQQKIQLSSNSNDNADNNSDNNSYNNSLQQILESSSFNNTDQSTGSTYCKSVSSYLIPISPMEVIYITYLASLTDVEIEQIFQNQLFANVQANNTNDANSDCVLVVTNNGDTTKISCTNANSGTCTTSSSSSLLAIKSCQCQLIAEAELIRYSIDVSDEII